MLCPTPRESSKRLEDSREKEKGRDRDKGNRERKRSQTRSGDRRDNRSNDRRGEPTKNGKRDKSPRVQKVDRDRRSEDEDDSSQERKELEKKLEKLKERKRTNRVRREIFEDEEMYIDLQRNWNESSGRQSRDRSVRTVKKSSPLTQRAAGVSSQQSSGSVGHKNDSTVRKIQEARGSMRSMCNLNESEDEFEEEEMTGYGD